MEESQKYKEGKFILEKAKIMKVGLPCALASSRAHLNHAGQHLAGHSPTIQLLCAVQCVHQQAQYWAL